MVLVGLGAARRACGRWVLGNGAQSSARVARGSAPHPSLSLFPLHTVRSIGVQLLLPVTQLLGGGCKRQVNVAYAELLTSEHHTYLSPPRPPPPRPPRWTTCWVAAATPTGSAASTCTSRWWTRVGGAGRLRNCSCMRACVCVLHMRVGHHSAGLAQPMCPVRRAQGVVLNAHIENS